MTGIVHDSVFLRHACSGHPECAPRLSAIAEALTTAGLLERMHPVAARRTTDAELETVHDANHVARVKQACAAGEGFLDPDTYVCSGSWEAATRAAGGTLDLTLEVLRGNLANGLALVRPPGHHATATQAMGFCLLNNVAVAAEAAIRQGGLQRVAIVDIDVHHGNGTEDIFAERPDVFYISTHQYPHFPGTGAATDHGRGEGLGATLNLPLSAGLGDEEILPIYERQVIGTLEEFGPQMILVSAGFDAHVDDPLAGLRLTTAGYTRIVGMLVDAAERLCDGRIVMVLEGGYNLIALGECLTATARVLLEAAGARD